ncbi:MAG: lipopolysaccharide heptosyltransferase II [bacterium]|nr:lipopolysaccharide heptosyltransferase II [bacterium]
MVIEYSRIKRILIIRLSSIGDVLLTSPLVRSIKKKYPAIQLDFLLREEFNDLVQNNLYIDVIYNYRRDKSENHSLISSLQSNNYDLVIDLQNNFRSREIVKKLKCPVLKFKKNNLKKFLLVHFKINMLKHADKIPERYAAAAHIQLDEEGLEYFTNQSTDSRFKENESYIGLCCGAKHFTKRWPLEYFIDLGKKLESAGYKVILFGGIDESKSADEIASHLNSAINLCCDSLSQTAANMKICKAVYTNDSGLMHLAAAMEVPVIAFFGSTVKEFGFYPYKAKSIELEIKDLSCRPCTHIGRASCPKSHFKCLKDIKPELAFQSLKNLLAVQ